MDKVIYYALKRGYSDKEIKTLALYAGLERTIKLNYFNSASEVPLDHIPVGYIDWVVEVLGYQPRPIDYPEFLKSLFGRKIWETDKWPLEKGIFIKPSDKPKRFEARITTGGYKGKKKKPYYCSEIVCFINEWRLYVVNGKIIYTGWYTGEDDDSLPPEFPQDLIPSDWCGVIDMGVTDDGRYLLVEANEPYSVGWYGKMNEGKILSEFLENGWKYLKENK